MMTPYTKSIFDKHDRGEQITQEEYEYLRMCTKPPTLREWGYIILAQPILCLLVYWTIKWSTT